MSYFTRNPVHSRTAVALVQLALGFSHDVVYEPPQGISIEIGRAHV